MLWFEVLLVRLAVPQILNGQELVVTVGMDNAVERRALANPPALATFLVFHEHFDTRLLVVQRPSWPRPTGGPFCGHDSGG